MPLFRLYVSGESTAVGVVVARNKNVANAFAQGKYGAGANAERVDWKAALEAGAVCEVIATETRYHGVTSTRTIV